MIEPDNPVGWVLAFVLAPFVALFYLGRVLVLRVFDPHGPRGLRAPSTLETVSLGCCLVWAALIAAWFML